VREKKFPSETTLLEKTARLEQVSIQKISVLARSTVQMRILVMFHFSDSFQKVHSMAYVYQYFPTEYIPMLGSSTVI